MKKKKKTRSLNLPILDKLVQIFFSYVDMEIFGKSKPSLMSLLGPISEDREITENFGNPSAMD